MTCFLNIKKDRLHPTQNNPWVHYVDKKKWCVDICHYDGGAWNIPSCQTRSPQVYDDLDTLCTQEFQRRNPGKMPTTKDKKKIAFNACNRKDLLCQIHLSDSLRRKLNANDKENVLITEHLLLKNSPFNNSYYWEKNNKLTSLKRAISSSRDRAAENIGMARCVLDHEGTSICYTGRPDSLLKAKQQAEMIFFRELATQKKGLKEKISPSGKRTYTLTYAVTSTLTLNLLMRWKWWGLIECPERKYAEEEVKAFEQLRQNIYELEDPETGETIRVKYRPILFAHQINAFGQLENHLPDSLSGKAFAQEISQQGLVQLISTAKKKIRSIQDYQKVQEVKALIKMLEQQGPDQLPEVTILTRDLLCKLIDLPIVYHCKSSTDRTAILIALSSALQQWRSLNNKPKKNMAKLLQETTFKELFAANLMIGHQITRIARGGTGEINGDRLEFKTLGLVLGSGLFQSRIITRLMPERYLKIIDSKKTLRIYAIIAFLISLLAIWKIKNYYSLVPKVKLNEDSPLVGQRKLLGGKD
jgi:hypothetical protein